MSIETIGCQSLLPTNSQKSVSFTVDPKSINTKLLKSPSKTRGQEALIEKERQRLLTKLFLEAQARLSAF